MWSQGGLETQEQPSAHGRWCSACHAQPQSVLGATTPGFLLGMRHEELISSPHRGGYAVPSITINARYSYLVQHAPCKASGEDDWVSSRAGRALWESGVCTNLRRVDRMCFHRSQEGTLWPEGDSVGSQSTAGGQQALP